MSSTESKNWVTALVVGILGLAVATIGIVLAYKQLRRTKRPDDVETARPKGNVLHDATVSIELTENPQ
jgi:septal ring-binding cell division protein DamX